MAFLARLDILSGLASRPGCMERLRVATLNLWNKSGPWEKRLPLVRRELTAISPDLMGLQEVLRLEKPASCQAEEIAQGLGYEVAYAPAWDLGHGLSMGNAVLSRFPIAAVKHWPLPVGRPDDGRCLVFVRVAAPCGEVPFFVTHFSYRPFEEPVRLRQAQAVAEHVMREAPVAGFPPILVGDFNAPPEADSVRYLTGLAVVEGKSVYFADAMAVAGTAAPTWDERNPFAAETGEASRRLDYVFVRGPDRGGRGRVISARLAWNMPDGGIYPSDHFGVVVEMTAAARSG
jgi:endonuclease/exonuclease/phosphatase family metal-dependent hydrolase